MNISVIGSGGWGTAIAMLLTNIGHDVTLHSVNTPKSQLLRESRENPRLKGVTLPEDLRYADGCGGAGDAAAIIVVTPSYALRETAAGLRGHISDKTIIVTATKGIEKGTSMLFSEVVEQELGGPERIAVLSGPSHAEEVGRGIPTGCVAASAEESTAHVVQDMFMSGNFRVYSSSDVTGVELCGALKNIYAIAAGICVGMGFGDNTLALLMTRALAEMRRLGIAMGCREDTFYGLAGVGDLIVTCSSQHSRNRRAGEYIGRGMTVDEARDAVGAVVEGFYAALSARELSQRLNVDMPIAEGAYSVLYEGRETDTVMAELMTRKGKNERH